LRIAHHIAAYVDSLLTDTCKTLRTANDNVKQDIRATPQPRGRPLQHAFVDKSLPASKVANTDLASAERQLTQQIGIGRAHHD
jgi:hypothetical protein